MNRTAILANRLAHTREQKGLRQEDVSKEITRQLKELYGLKKGITLQSVSGWEKEAVKDPTLKEFIIICEYLDVSADYLLGFTNIPQNKEIKPAAVNAESYMTPNYLVPMKNLHAFHGEPIYVVFNDKCAQDGWGIYDDTKKRIVLRDKFLNISKKIDCTFYANVPEYMKTAKYILGKRLTMRQLTSHKKVWVEMITMDQAIREKYNGWYEVSDDRESLVNTRGMVLRIEGLNISYTVYSGEANK